MNWLIISISTVLAIVLLAGTYIFHIEPYWYDVRQVTLTLPNLPAAFDRYRLVQLTDIHVDDRMNADRLQHVVRLVKEQQPDLVVMTGDYITGAALNFVPDLIEGFQNLQAPDGVFAVLGNHDEWTNPVAITTALQKIGIKVLENEVVNIRRQDDFLPIAGVGDVWAERADLRPILAQLKNLRGAILLAHEPDFADTSAATGRFDLQLSGHTHGGQVDIPGFNLVLPPLGYKYPVGQYQVNDMIQYTSRGVGMVKPRGRFNCRPEITVLTLRSASQHSAEPAPSLIAPL